MSTSGVLSFLRGAAGGHADVPPRWRRGGQRQAYDVLVVGGDALALLIAWSLARRGEAGAVGLVTAGALGAVPAGQTLCLHAFVEPPPLTALAVRGLATWRGLSEEAGYALGLGERPALCLGGGGDGMRDARARVHLARACGAVVEDAGAADRADTVGRQRDAAIVDMAPLVVGLARAASAAGADLLERRAVAGLGEGGVVTAEGPLRARQVVLVGAEGAALGTWPLRAERRRVLVSEPLTPCLDALLVHPGQGLTLAQAASGAVVARGTGSVEALAAQAVALVPPLSRLRVATWREEVSLTGRDGAPVVGALGDGLHAAFAGDDAALWPELARLVVDGVIGRPDAVATPVAPDRFADGRLLGVAERGGAA